MKIPPVSSLIAIALTCIAPTLQADPSLTIYNQGFAVVRDSLSLDLKAGSNSISYSGATAQVEPESVILRDPAGKVTFQILEQSYRNDPADQGLLLKLFEGQTIDFESPGENGKTFLQKGKVVRSAKPNTGISPIIEVEGKLRFDLPGIPLFPSLGDNTILQPTFTWQINSPIAAKLTAELAYVSYGFSWRADYNVVLPEKGDTADMVSWISMRNQSGKVFENAKVKLLAGDVQKQRSHFGQESHGAFADVYKPEVTEKAFDDFHLYSLERPVTLRDRETKQVEFHRAAGIKTHRYYVYDGGQTVPHDDPFEGSFKHGAGPEEATKKVTSYVEFKNSEENKLGIPLPAGRMRFYRMDGEQLQFVGEASIDHTPRNEMLLLQMGSAFDLVGERKRTDFTKHPNRNELTETIEIKLRNRKTEPAEIRVVEHPVRFINWEIVNSTLPHTKYSAAEIEFRVPLQPDEEKVISYTVKYTW